MRGQLIEVDITHAGSSYRLLEGQLLPPGAGGNLLRSTGFFDGVAAGGHVAVLAVWALAGFAALVVAAARVRRPELRRARGVARAGAGAGAGAGRRPPAPAPPRSAAS